MSRGQHFHSPPFARRKEVSKKIHAPGKLGRVRIIDQELSIAISLESTLLSLLAFRATSGHACPVLYTQRNATQRVTEPDNK